MAVNYRVIKTTFHQVPVTMLEGQPNTNKMFLSKVCASLVGGLNLHAIYLDLTMSQAVTLLAKSVFCVYNDPTRSEVLKTIITQVSDIMYSESHVESSTLMLLVANLANTK